jgi:Phage tail tube protein
MTDSNRTRLALVKETTRNTTPSNPIFQTMRVTGITLGDTNQTVVSDEIRSDRMSSGEILVGRAGGEGFNFEFSNSHFDDLLVASLLGTRQRIAFKYNNGVADSEITAVTDSSDTYTVNSGGTAFKAGHLAKAEGFTNAANNQIFPHSTSFSGGACHRSSEAS